MPYFDKETTKYIKGIALIMMFWHHFFTFPNWWGEGITYPMLEKLAPYFCVPFKICVPVFCFLTGYFYYFSKQKTLRYSVKKITDVLVSYWLVLLVFIVVAKLTVNHAYSLSEILLEMFGMVGTTMTFCWYVYFYCAIMLVLPFFNRILLRDKVLDMAVVYLLLPYACVYLSNHISNSILQMILQSMISWLPVVMTGYLFARYRGFEWLEGINQRITDKIWANRLLWLFLLISAAMGRWMMPFVVLTSADIPKLGRQISVNITLDVIYATVFIYCLVKISDSFHLSRLESVIRHIGDKSLSMWFVSCLFFNVCSKVTQPLLYWPRNPILVLLWGLLFCYIVSLGIDYVAKIIQRYKNSLLKW